jgi:23S rRNA (uridine2552-2'-O)-methyltransferase
VADRRKDVYYRAARREGLRSRAAFKLVHLAERFPIFRPGDRVLDLGAAPGGWSLVALQIVGPRGAVVAVDPRTFEPIEGVRWVRGRVGDADLTEAIGPGTFQVVLSDMSPSISGAYATDHARSVSLVQSALRLAQQTLAPGGSFVAKIFDGDLIGELDATARPMFRRWQHTKPPASRAASSEIYVLGFGFHGAARDPPPERPRRPPPE